MRMERNAEDGTSILPAERGEWKLMGGKESEACGETVAPVKSSSPNNLVLRLIQLLRVIHLPTHPNFANLPALTRSVEFTAQQPTLFAVPARFLSLHSSCYKKQKAKSNWQVATHPETKAQTATPIGTADLLSPQASLNSHRHTSACLTDSL